MTDIHEIPGGTENQELPGFLAGFELTVPEKPDLCLGIYEGGSLIGCGFLKGNMLQGLAVDERYQGQGLSGQLVTELIRRANLRGIRQLTVITKPAMAEKLSSLGLRMVAAAEPYAAMLEYGSGGARRFMEQLKKTAAENPGPSAALVINGNPFTNGHYWLAKQASAENERVYVLIVQEDRSEFTFEERFAMASESLREFDNVTVIPSGPYVVSSLTFPSYFTKEENLAAAHTALDAEVFGSVYVPALQIRKRYLGTEPASAVTRVYNETLKKRLPKYGVQVEELPRLTAGTHAVSASDVRELLREEKYGEAWKLVPEASRKRIERRLNLSVSQYQL